MTWKLTYDWEHETQADHYDEETQRSRHYRTPEQREAILVRMEDAIARYVEIERDGMRRTCRSAGDWIAHGRKREVARRDFFAALEELDRSRHLRKGD